MNGFTRAKHRLLRLYERAVDRMDEFDRWVFLGYRVEDLSFRELAERHGVSTAEIEEAMIRALRGIAQTADRKNRRRCQFWRR